MNNSPSLFLNPLSKTWWIINWLLLSALVVCTNPLEAQNREVQHYNKKHRKELQEQRDRLYLEERLENNAQKQLGTYSTYIINKNQSTCVITKGISDNIVGIEQLSITRTNGTVIIAIRDNKRNIWHIQEDNTKAYDVTKILPILEK